MKPARPALTSVIEPLEARIAPAVIRIGAQGTFENTTDTEYREAVNPNIEGQDAPRPDGFNLLSFTDTSASLDPISLAVHGGATNTFFLRLKAGDVVERFSETGNYKPFIVVKAGNVIAYFTDNVVANNEFDDGELTGLSLGKGASVEVSGSVNGDIASNLDERGTKDIADDTIDMTGLVSTKQGITNLRVLGGSVFGNIFSAGNIKNTTLAKNVDSVLAGTAANGQAFDFFTGSAGGKGIFTVAPAPGVAGASITTLLVNSITSRLEAGAGGAGGKGGSVTNVQVTGDADGFAILGGAGGNGDAAARKINGGAGGSVGNILVSGITDPTPGSPNAIVLRGGLGGDGLTTGKGGAGGGATKIRVGYEQSSGGVVESGALLSDAVAVFGGGGGAGKIGGLGGSVTDAKIRLRTPEVNGVEISIVGGDGGSSLSPVGKAGGGGSVKNLDLRNQSVSVGTDVLVQSGRGGSTVGAGRGAAGGLISTVMALSFDHQYVAGDGSDGKIGGVGGSITAVTLLSDESVQPHNLLFDAGKGGDGAGGNGGNAGNISNILANSADLVTFIVNSGVKGNGGNSAASQTAAGGKGGKGGSITKVIVIDGDSDAVNSGVAVIRAGSGGNGDKGGGIGGSIAGLDFTATDLGFDIASGDGGDVTLKGKGGAAGAIANTQILTGGLANLLPVSGLLVTGQGGDGKGANGSGGAGGNINVMRLSVSGNAEIRAGNGGSGEAGGPGVAGGAAGHGGSLLAVGMFATEGSATLRAGDGGALGVKAGNGGSIKGENVSRNPAAEPTTIIGVRGTTDITIVAGNGTHGGFGGNIIGITYGSTSQVLLPTPSGDILVRAGSGSAEGKLAGRGGSIDRLDGSVSSGVNKGTTILAGDGGGFAGGVKAGAGGSIRNLSISRGGAAGVDLIIRAGDAGDATAASAGAAGGSIFKVDVSLLDPAAVFRSVAAGDGGDAGKKGGVGGSVQGVKVDDHDIGVRLGQVFGYNTMGGIFAGVGGVAGVGGKAGLNGNVIDVRADAIASIVAGRGAVPQLVEKASLIQVNGIDQDLLYNLNSVFPGEGPFRIFVGADFTSILPGNATGLEMQTALNALNGIQMAGGVTVSFNRSLGYQIRWNNPGDRAELIALETVSAEVTEETPGATSATSTTEVKRGQIDFTAEESRPGVGVLPLLEINPGLRNLTSTEVAAAVPGVSGETQLINTAFLAPFPTGTFTLTFLGETTGALPANATAAQVSAALNALASIVAEGGVSVIEGGGARSFLITFLGVDGPDPDTVPDIFNPQNPIAGTFFVPETQRLNLSPISSIAGSTFTLTYLGNTSVVIPSTANAGDIQAALAPIVAPDAVTVSAFSPGIFDITFTTTGDRAEIVGASQVREIQTLTLGNFVNEAPADFYVLYGVDRTAVLTPTVTAAQLDDALEALPSIGLNGVTVDAGANNSFIITFASNGQKQELIGLGKVQERQRLDLSSLANSPTSEFALFPATFAEVTETNRGATTALPTATTVAGRITPMIAITTDPGSAGNSEIQYVEVPPLMLGQPGAEFYLQFAGNRTAFLPVMATELEVEAALNAIMPVGLTVTVAAPQVGAFQITFSSAADEQQITGNAGVRETQTLSLTPLVGVPGAQFTAGLGAQVTVPLAVPATAANIDAALDVLPALALFGGVTVTQTSANNFSIRPNDFGNIPQITAGGGGTAAREVQLIDLRPFAAVPDAIFNLTFRGETTGLLVGTATAGDVQTALNGLISIQNLHADGGGMVAVTEPTPDVFEVTFNIFGDQQSVLGTLGKDDPATAGLAFRFSERIAYNSTAAEVEAAIESVSFHGVTVTPGVAPGIFEILYDANALGDQPALEGFISTHEQQKLDVYAIGNFTVIFDNQTQTGDFDLATAVNDLPAGATAVQVQQALLSIPSIQALPVVRTGQSPLTVTANADSSYTVVFDNVDGDVAFLGADQFENFTVRTVQAGNATTNEIQVLTAIVKGEFLATAYANASLVGAIVDINEIDSKVFKFKDALGTLLSAANRAFQLGDTPIDGILMAKSFDQATANFTPEARLTAAGFFDNDNIIS